MNRLQNDLRNSTQKIYLFSFAFQWWNLFAKRLRGFIPSEKKKLQVIFHVLSKQSTLLSARESCVNRLPRKNMFSVNIFDLDHAGGSWSSAVKQQSSSCLSIARIFFPENGRFAVFGLHRNFHQQFRGKSFIKRSIQSGNDRNRRKLIWILCRKDEYFTLFRKKNVNWWWNYFVWIPVIRMWDPTCKTFWDFYKNVSSREIKSVHFHYHRSSLKSFPQIMRSKGREAKLGWSVRKWERPDIRCLVWGAMLDAHWSWVPRKLWPCNEYSGVVCENFHQFLRSCSSVWRIWTLR